MKREPRGRAVLPHRLVQPCSLRAWPRIGALLLALASGFATSAHGQSELREATQLLSEASLEELLEVQVTTVSKRAERLTDSAASVTVITAEDIARSPSTQLQELFRLVPGMQVGRLNNSHHAISTRGGNSMFASNLLVMVDGRTVYSPVFSGVWWDTQAIPLEEISRIEIIRGPGASLWGVNAVNGVINIITKDAATTRGGLVSVSGGSQERSNLYARYGSQYADDGFVRLYARRMSLDETHLADGRPGQDDMTAERVGVRLDQSFGAERKLTFTGETYRIDSGGGPIPVPTPVPMQTVQLPSGYPQHGFHAMARYAQPAAGGNLTLQGYYIHEMLTGTAIGMSYWRHTWDFDFQHAIDFAQHRLIWGGGARKNTLEMEPSHYVSFNPKQVGDRLTNLFIQDEIALLDHRLRVTVGSKFEHSSDSGLEVQPTLRALYALGTHEVIWAAASRAARIPFWGQQYVTINQEWQAPGCVPQLPGLPCAISLRGNPQSKSETMNNVEIGYRVRPSEQTVLDVSAFVTRGKDVMSIDVDPARVTLQSGYLSVPMGFGNQGSFTNRGIETSLDWQVRPGLRLRAGSSWFWEDYAEWNSIAPREVRNVYYDNSFGRWTAFVRGSHDWHRWSLDWTVRRAEAPLRYGKDHTALDLRLNWQAARDLELWLAGVGLGSGKRMEFDVPWFVLPTRNEPHWSLGGRWHF
jgi:iron complex outermembrane receptor protein